jgi:hypothetical protein
MLEYRHPTVFAPGVEARINGLVHDLVGKLGAPASRTGAATASL